MYPARNHEPGALVPRALSKSHDRKTEFAHTRTHTSRFFLYFIFQKRCCGFAYGTRERPFRKVSQVKNANGKQKTRETKRLLALNFNSMEY